MTQANPSRSTVALLAMLAGAALGAFTMAVVRPELARRWRDRLGRRLRPQAEGDPVDDEDRDQVAFV
jgi:hypothetical protein